MIKQLLHFIAVKYFYLKYATNTLLTKILEVESLHEEKINSYLITTERDCSVYANNYVPRKKISVVEIAPKLIKNPMLTTKSCTGCTVQCCHW